MILTIHWVSIRYNSSRISVHFLFLLSVYYVPNGCVNDPLADKLLTKDQYRENLRVSERAERPSLEIFSHS